MYKEYVKKYFDSNGLALPDSAQIFKGSHIFYNFQKHPHERAVLKLIRKTLGRGYSFQLVPRGLWTGDSPGGQVYLVTREDERYFLKISESYTDVLGMILASHLHKEIPFPGFNVANLLYFGSLQTKENPLLFFSIAEEAPGIDIIESLEEGNTSSILEFTEFVGKKIAQLGKLETVKASDKNKIIFNHLKISAHIEKFYTAMVRLDPKHQERLHAFHAKAFKKILTLQVKSLEQDQYLIPYYAQFGLHNLRYDPQNQKVTFFDTTALAQLNSGERPPLVFPDLLIGLYLNQLDFLLWENQYDKKLLTTSIKKFLASYKSHTQKRFLTKTGIQLWITQRVIKKVTKIMTASINGDESYCIKEVLDHYEPFLEDDHMLYAALDDL